MLPEPAGDNESLRDVREAAEKAYRSTGERDFLVPADILQGTP